MQSWRRENLNREFGRLDMKLSFTTAAAAAVLFTLSGLAQAGDSVLIITHEVKDFAAWKVGYDNDKPNRDKAGLVQRFLVRDADKPNLVTIVLEAPDSNAARSFTSNVALKDAMTKAGVVSQPTITIGNKAK
jgi:hypothetical protein